jgi:hypothetical protein
MAFVHYYHPNRSHRGLGDKTPGQVDSGETPREFPSADGVSLMLREAFGGTLKQYEPKAA